MANYYVIGNGTTAPNLTGTPYEGYKVITQSQLDGPVVSRFELAPDDKVVVSGSTSGSVNLHPKFSLLGVEQGQTVDVTVLPSTNTTTINFTSNGGREFTPTINVTGSAPNVSIEGSSTQNMTLNVANNAAIGNVQGGTDSNDVDTITTGTNSTIGNIYTSGGADSVTIGGKAGTIATGDGNDRVTVNGTSGAIDTGAGNDALTVNGVSGAITSGNGDDAITINGRGGTVDAGNGSDKVTLGDRASVGEILLRQGGDMGDTVVGGSNVTVNGNISQDSGQHYSTVTLGDGAMVTGSVDLHDGHDTFSVGANSTVAGHISVGSDLGLDDPDYVGIGDGSTVRGYINTNTGNDTVVLGDNVTLLGGSNAINTEIGEDTVIIGKGVTATNPIFTGAGSDHVIIEGAGNYTVDQGFLGGNNDVVEVWSKDPDAFNSALGKPYDANVDAYHIGVNTTYSPLPGVTVRNADYAKGVPCFTPGTLIDTDRGPVAVEALAVGDLVVTRDRGLQPIRWIGAQRISAAELTLAPQLRPVRIAAGALGGGMPLADLTVSPWHRMVVRSAIVAEMEGADEALVAATNLTALDGVTVADDPAEVVYIHFMCDRHEVIIANGALTETLHIGESTAEMMPAESLAEIMFLFPELQPGQPQPMARRPVPGPRGRWMVKRHLDAGLPLVG